MTQQEAVELVAPTQIVKGDIIEDPLGHRWLNVRGVRILTADGVYSFYGGPGDRVTFEGDERVKRRKR